MRKTIIQSTFLLIAGAVILWREWTAEITVPVVNVPLSYTFPTGQLAETSSSIIWLVGVAGVVVVLTEWYSRYFKLSSPNSV